MGTYIGIYLIAVVIGAVLSYRLPDSVIPGEYKLEIITNLGDEDHMFNFHGKVLIDVTCTSPTNSITLHSKDLQIEEQNVHVRPLHSKSSKNLKVTNIEFVKKDDFLIIHLSEHLKEGHKYEIEISFSGEMDESLAGYYKSNYIDKETGKKTWLAVTQFEPSDARRAFPCFDEPAMKAKFTISLGRHHKYSSLSNMPIVRIEPMKDKSNWEWDRYETSVPMSTYLVAFAVTDFAFEISPKYENNVTFSTWCRKDAINQISFAKDIGPKFLRFYEKYFDIDYPLPKQDMIALPDFSAGAMENWGLITYRETFLLFDPKQSSTMNKVGIASVVAHELAHQWFGNLVTMKWWTDLWLNEGFATYMSAVAVDKVFPEWQYLREETVDNLLAVFSFDSLQNSHPVSVPIGHPKEIEEIFDTISYKKGSYLLHMMANFLGVEILRMGVSNYLKLHKYDNAAKDDLWNSITEEAHRTRALPHNLTVNMVMDSWALQTGFPLITVKRNYGQETLQVTQERFFRDRKKLKTEETKWWIPLSYTTESELYFTNTKPRRWISPVNYRTTINVVSNDTEWIIFNIKASVLARVNYDEKNWNLLIKYLKGKDFEKIPVLNRVLLIDDSANLASIGRQNYKIFFDILNYLEHEKEYLPWKAAIKNTGHLDTLLKRSSVYGEFREYLSRIIRPIYNKIGGFHKASGEDNIYMIQHRVLVTSVACKYHVEHCITEALEIFKKLRSNSSRNDDFPNDLRDTIYCNGVKYGGHEEWNFLWNMYLHSNVASVKNSILKALGCTRQPWLLQRYLEWAIDGNSGIRKQDITGVFASVIANDIGFYIARNFIHDNIKGIYERTKPTGSKLSAIISSLASYMIRTPEHEWLTSLTTSNQEYFREIRNGVNQALETSRLNVQWHEVNSKDIREQLRNFKL